MRPHSCDTCYWYEKFDVHEDGSYLPCCNYPQDGYRHCNVMGMCCNWKNKVPLWKRIYLWITGKLVKEGE